MSNTRKYESSPYEIAVLHGGPGAVGNAPRRRIQMSVTDKDRDKHN